MNGSIPLCNAINVEFTFSDFTSQANLLVAKKGCRERAPFCHELLPFTTGMRPDGACGSRSAAGPAITTAGAQPAGQEEPRHSRQHQQQGPRFRHRGVRV